MTKTLVYWITVLLGLMFLFVRPTYAYTELEWMAMTNEAPGYFSVESIYNKRGSVVDLYFAGSPQTFWRMWHLYNPERPFMYDPANLPFCSFYPPLKGKTLQIWCLVKKVNGLIYIPPEAYGHEWTHATEWMNKEAAIANPDVPIRRE